MACKELFRVNIKQSGSWVVLWCIRWTCAADFSSRYVICMIPFFMTSISPTRQHTCWCAALCEISRVCYPSVLPTSTPHHSSRCAVYLFRQLGWNWASQAQRPYPLIHGRKTWYCFKPRQSWLQFSTTKFKFGWGLYCPIICFLDFLTSI